MGIGLNAVAIQGMASFELVETEYLLRSHFDYNIKFFFCHWLDR